MPLGRSVRLVDQRRRSLPFGLIRATIAALALMTGPAASTRDSAAGQAAAQSDPTRRIWGHKLRLIADGRVIHRFFDTSPVSPSGRYVALLRLPYENRSPVAGDLADVVIVDLRSKAERVVARTRGWEMQLGAQVQWGRTDRDLLFNDVDPASWRAFAVSLDPGTMRRKRIDGPLFMASTDGATLAGHDLATARFAQVGYGVVVPDSAAPRRLGPRRENGVFVTDVATGRRRLIASSYDIFRTTNPALAVAAPDDHEFYVFQTKWNPQNTRLLVSYQWSKPGAGRSRAVITMRADGSDIRTAVTAAQWARGGHHINWMADGEHVSMNLDVDAEPGLELVTVRYDGSDMKTVFKPGSGHPSMHPAGLPLMITDAYPEEPLTRRDGTVPLRLINLRTGKEHKVAEVYVSMTGGEFRIDPHPAWDRSGRYVVFNGFVGGTRNVWMVDLNDFVQAEAAAARRPR